MNCSHLQDEHARTPSSQFVAGYSRCTCERHLHIAHLGSCVSSCTLQGHLQLGACGARCLQLAVSCAQVSRHCVCTPGPQTGWIQHGVAVERGGSRQDLKGVAGGTGGCQQDSVILRCAPWSYIFCSCALPAARPSSCASSSCKGTCVMRTSEPIQVNTMPTGNAHTFATLNDAYHHNHTSTHVQGLGYARDVLGRGGCAGSSSCMSTTCALATSTRRRGCAHNKPTCILASWSSHFLLMSSRIISAAQGGERSHCKHDQAMLIMWHQCGPVNSRCTGRACTTCP